MIQEFKVLTSNFSAENQKGPAVIQSIAKAGTRDFHGTGYLYARHHSMNSNDWLNNRVGAPKPANKYFFPGGNIGGPVLIPGTNFNKNRDKLFFFTGYEHFFQTLDTGLLRATVPTEGMRQGNFSESELRKIEGLVNGSYITSSGSPAQRISAEQFPNGIIPPSQIDPSGRALMNLLPLPNADPSATNGFNYVRQIVFNQNSMQWMSRVDYSISDNTKLFVRYNMQRETQKFPVGLWWRNANQVPYPTPVLGKNASDSVSASLTHVFNPTLTNEFIFGYTFIAFPNVFEDPSKVERANVGFPTQGLFKNGVTQIPAFTGWGGEMATMLNPGGFEVGGSRGLFADKYLPSLQNNTTKVWGTHSVKFGAYWEYIRNNQPANPYTNGLAVFSNWGSNTTGSGYGDMLTGRITQYEESSFARLNDIGYHTAEFFVQDSWKATRRLTLDLGLRASHFQPWQDRQGFGYAVFDYAKFNPNAPATEYSGFLWNARDPSVPNAGFATRPLYWAPRFGMAYDIFGTGRTVFRGGWGRFFFHTPQFTNGLDVSAGVRRRVTPSGTTFAEINSATVGAGDALGVQAVDRNSDLSPYSDSYSATISQRTGWRGVLELSYVGNRSRNLINNGHAGSNINLVPYGAFFNQPGLNVNDANPDNYRPLRGFQDVSIMTHGLFMDYNSMQVTWNRTSGRFNILMNYTWGKSMGIVNINAADQGDRLNLGNNYGVMPFDRRHIFNAAYSIELGNPVAGNPVLKGLVNGWQLSGITQLQSGQNLAALRNFFSSDVTIDSAYTIDVNGVPVQPGQRSVTGTTSVAWRPLWTCDPGANLQSNQFVNGNCLALPTGPGQNGPMVAPPIYGPAFFNSDLGMFKNFQMGESKRLQFRFNAYNFLNHPLWSFIGGSANLKPSFDAQGRMNNPVFGTTTEKQGRRIVQLAIKYYF
jgi:hypothetical protein